MDPAAPDDRRRRRLLIATIAGALVLLLLVGVGVYGLLRGPATPTDPTPSDRSSEMSTSPGPTPGARPESISQNVGPETFARAVAVALFTWDTTSGYQAVDYAQVLADVAADDETDALAGDVRAYLPNPQAWAQLRQYQTRQWLTIDTAVIPAAWETAVAQAAPGQIPDGAVAYTIEGTRHRDGTWGTEPVEASRPVTFTVFIVCTPVVTDRGITGTGCELLRLSQLDNPLR